MKWWTLSQGGFIGSCYMYDPSDHGDLDHPKEMHPYNVNIHVITSNSNIGNSHDFTPLPINSHFQNSKRNERLSLGIFQAWHGQN